ncbi:MAG: LysR family transcriptional regulator [Rhodanobacteraceae bacterium]|nr:MAG: LysR family transcriptional regulator [Rhodanobacteraceae bacterium]
MQMTSRKPGKKGAARRPLRPAGLANAGESAARFYYKGNRYKQLRAFVAIVKLGTLARAAESLFLSAPSISLQLQALERELGAQLVERGRRRIVVTRAGEALYEQAKPLVEGLDALDTQFHSAVAGLGAGELTIAAGSSTIQYLLPSLVARYREKFPGVRLQLANVTGKDGLAMLRSNEVDFAVGSMLDEPHDITYQPFRHYDPMLILPIGHPLATKPDLHLADLSQFGLILPPHRLTTYRLVDLVFQRNKVPYTVAIEVGGWEVIKQYVAMGLGISIVTSICLTDADSERLVARDMQAWFPQRSYGVVIRKGKYLSTEARDFMAMVKLGMLTHREHDEPGDSER